MKTDTTKMTNNGGRYWPRAIIAAFIIFAGATLTFVFFAVGRQVDMVSTRYYEDGVHYDSTIARKRNSRALAQPVALVYNGSTQSVELRFPSAAGAPAGTIHFYRPSDAALDRRYSVAPDARGRQYISVAGLAAGNWKVRVEWQAGRRSFYDEFFLNLL